MIFECYYKSIAPNQGRFELLGDVWQSLEAFVMVGHQEGGHIGVLRCKQTL